jgi:hypothetical protein
VSALKTKFRDKQLHFGLDLNNIYETVFRMILLRHDYLVKQGSNFG